MRLFLPVAAVLFCLGYIESSFAATSRSWAGGTSTDWNTAGNWSPSGIPANDDPVTIPSAPANQPVIASAGGNCANLTIDSGATLTISSTGNLAINSGATVTINGSIVFSGTGVMNGGANGSSGIALSINSGGSVTTTHANGVGAVPGANGTGTGSFQMNKGNKAWTFNAGANYTFNGTSAQTMGAAISGANNLTINNAAGISSSASFTLSGTMTVQAGALFTPGAAHQINSAGAAGTISGSGTIQVTRITGTPDLVNQYNFSAFTLTSMTVEYAGAGAQTINGSATVGTYRSIRTTGSGTKTAGGDFTVSSVLTVLLGTALDASTRTITLSGSGSPIVVSGTFTASSSTVSYTSTTGANVTGGLVYNNLTVNSAGQTFTASADLTVSSVLTIAASTTFNASSRTIILSGSGTPFVVSGTFTPSTSTMSYTSTTGANVTGGTYNNLTVNRSGQTFTAAGDMTVGAVLTVAASTTFDASSRTMTLSSSGTPLVVTGTFTPSTSTVRYTSGSGASVTATTYNNLTVNGAGTFSLAANLPSAIAGAFSVQGGTFDANGKTVSVTGLTTTSGGTYLASTATQTFNGGLTVSGGTFTGSSGTVNAANVTLSSGTLTAPNSSGAFNVSGNWVNNGATFTHNSGTVTLNGTSAQAISGSSSSAFSSLTIANTSATVSANASLSAAGNLTINASALFSPAATVVVSGGGTLTGGGTVQTTKTGTSDDFGNQYTITTKTLAGLTLEFAGAAAQNSSTASYGGLKINNANGVTLQADTTVGATLTFSSGKITTGANTLIIGAAGSVSGAAAAQYVFGTVQKALSAGSGQSFSFPIGDASNYTPAALANLNVTTPGTLTATNSANQHPNISTSGINSAKDVQRYWTLTAGGGLVVSAYDLTLNFVSGDLIGGASTSAFVIRRYNGSSWSTTTTGTRTATSTSATGLSAFGDFAIGEQLANAYRLTAATSTLGPGVGYPLTIRLVDQLGATLTSFNGDKSITFSGLANAGNGTHPTITDKTGTPVNIGNATTVTLASGVNSAGGTLTAYKAETATLTANDGSSSTASTGGAALGLTITNALPVANTDAFSRQRNVQLRVPLSALLTNDTDANLDNLSFAAVISPSTNGGTIANNSTFFLYTPPTSGGNVTDAFTYKVADGALTNTGTVVITIAPTPTGTNYNIVRYGTDGSNHPDIIFAGVPGFTYVVQVTSDLSGSPAWTDKQTTNAPAGGLWEFIDTSPPNPAYYRAINQ